MVHFPLNHPAQFPAARWSQTSQCFYGLPTEGALIGDHFLGSKNVFIHQLAKPPLSHNASASSDYMNIIVWFLLKFKKIQVKDQSLEPKKHRIELTHSLRNH